MKATKAFVSYSWSGPEHEEWVLELATDLTQSGVDIILDKWDLKEGREANAFMEKMVSDKGITKVIIVSDRAYAEKSNARKGGAGTEAQIISKELYEKEDQDKFVAVVREKDENGKPYLPAYYTSRIYIDFTDSARFSERFEQLLRWIANKPIHKRPELGKLPTYLTEEDNGILLATSASHRRAYDAITGLKEHAFPATKEYFELFTSELEKFRMSDGVDVLGDDFLSNFQSFVPYRNECLDVIRAVARYTHDVRFSDLLHGFFEDMLQYFEAPEEMKSYSSHSFDNYKFFAHELFLHSGAMLFDEGRHDLFNSLVEKQYYMDRRATSGLDPLVEFTVFRKHLDSLECRQKKLTPRRHSISADMIKERTTGSGTHFRKIMQVDFLFFLRAELADHGPFSGWWPETLVYLGFDCRAFEIFDRSRSSGYFESVRPFLGDATKDDLEKLVRESGNNGRNLPGSGFDRVLTGVLLGIEQLCTRP